MCDSNVYPQSFEPCEMPEQFQNAENYISYDQQQGEGMQFDPQNFNFNQHQQPQQQSQDYYDDPNQCFNMSGEECVEYCNPNEQQDLNMNMENDGNMQDGGDSCRLCSDSCQLLMCSPFKTGRYIQPPRRESFKPMTSYRRPTIPMASDTIYRKSFEGIDSQTANCCRMPPFNPSGFLRTPKGPFAKETVTKMSYQPFCGVERVKPIFPNSRSLLGKGPMQGLTTQKHDFVPKFQYKRSKITPKDNISKSCGCFEKCTVQKLSFMPHCGVSRTESCRPIINYKRPEIPMECETTQKLSYLPVCPSPKDDMPWARKSTYKPPTLPFAKETVTKLSYQAPGCFVDDGCCEPCPKPCPEMPRAAC